MYLKKLFIILLVSSSLSYSYAQEIPENIETLTNSIMKITIEGVSDKKRITLAYGTGFLIKDENEQLRVVTNFHIIDGVETIENIYAENDKAIFLLRPEALSSLHDIALLRVEGTHEHLESQLEQNEQVIEQIKRLFMLGQSSNISLEKPIAFADADKYLGKALELRERPLEPWEQLYLLGFRDENRLLTLVPMDYVSFSTFKSELKFIRHYPKFNLRGASGSPITDKNGKVVSVHSASSYKRGILNGLLYRYSFGPANNLLSYSTNKDFIKCPKSLIASRACITQARLKLFEKMQSDDLIISTTAQNRIIRIYAVYTVKDFINYFERRQNIDGERLDLQTLFQLFDRSDPIIRDMIDGSDSTVLDFMNYIKQKKSSKKKTFIWQALFQAFTKKKALAEEKTIKRNTPSTQTGEACKNAILK